MTLLSLVLINTGCDERFYNPEVNPSEGKTVEVSMNIGFADETDAYNLSASTKTTLKEKGAFDVALLPTIVTRADATVKPNALYKLEIRQYDKGGTYLNSGQNPADQTVGQRLTVNLKETQNCQLVFVVWGENSTKSLGTINLAKAQEISIDASMINNIKPENMNTMPYVLHLKNVNVTADGKITNPEGEDVRILLKRLATRLNITWKYNVADYTLKQIILQSIPRNYKVVAAPDKDNQTYPSLMDQYNDIQLSNEQISSGKGSYSCWIPANVRGFNTASNSPLYRIKNYAPTGSSYISFIASNSADEKKKLNYRIYLGGKDYSDYNLAENTDYSYEVNFNHTDLPVDDKRVTIIDPIPASDNNKNFVPTANCFMIAPGGAFCFNPYKYYVNDVIIENSLLQNWCSSGKIQSVKVLWQTKENGDIGDPVLGVVNTSEDHTNIVNISDGDDFNKARIYCRVAPNTTGGSGVIAAYASTDGTGYPLWSWHIWVTEYNPDARGNTTILTPVNKRKLKFTYNNVADQPPMMDRNLGAIAGFTLSDPPHDQLDMSKANGLHYQWGRKDPFPSSYSANPISVVTGLTSKTVPPKGMLNRYAPDGITYVPLSSVTSKTTVRNAFQHPTTVYIQSEGAIDWCNETSTIPTLWNSPNNETGTKTFYDPCPVGWRVVSYKHLRSFFTVAPGSDGTTTGKTLNLANPTTFSTDGGAYFYYAAEGSGEATYIRMTGYWRFANEFHYIGQRANWWLREHIGTTGKANYGFYIDGEKSTMAAGISKGWYPQDVHTTRCIQELP